MRRLARWSGHTQIVTIRLRQPVRPLVGYCNQSVSPSVSQVTRSHTRTLVTLAGWCDALNGASGHQPRQFRMDPWARNLPVGGGALRTLDSGQSFKGPPSKVLSIPGCDQHILVAPRCPGLTRATPACCCGACCCCPCSCCCVTNRPSISLRAPASGCTRSRPTGESSPSNCLLSGSSGIAIVSRGQGVQPGRSHVVSYHGHGVVSHRRRRCQSTVPPGPSGLYRIVQDCSDLYRI